MRFTTMGVSITIVTMAVIISTIYLLQNPLQWTNTQPKIGGPFKLINQHGNRVSDKTFLNNYVVVFFGFTHCPDICTTALQTVTKTLESLGEEAKKINIIFVTVDPIRDTPQILKKYLSHFDKRIIGLTGSQKEISEMIRNFRAYARKVKNNNFPNNYTVDHSTFLYLLGPNGKFITHFAHHTPHKKIKTRISIEMQKSAKAT
ncbi:MAG: hypothetical protein TECD_00691 [Hyphomicrobiaceae bacterium hypho_1]